MGSTNIPSNKDIKKVRIQYETADERAFDLDIDALQFQEVLRTLVYCKYKSAGCIRNDHAKDIKAHEDHCLYRAIQCPILPGGVMCESVQPVKLVEHVTEHHNSNCISTVESIFSLPIDVEEHINLSKMVTIHEDIFLCLVKSEAQKLRTTIFCIRNINAYVNCEVTLMADHVIWGKQKFQFLSGDLGYNEHNDQSALFELEQLIKAKSIFNSITLQVECNIADQDSVAQSEEFLQKIMCAWCGDFLSSIYYKYEKLHTYCQVCYVFRECIRQVYIARSWVDGCNLCSLRMSLEIQYSTVLDSLKNYEYPCQNQSLGCNQYIRRFTSKHELLCPFNVFNCDFKCDFAGKYSSFISHLQENHTEDIVNSNVYNGIGINKKSFYMFVFGAVFLCRIIDDRTCTLEWMSTSDIKYNFVFEVTFHCQQGRRIILRTSTEPREINYVIDEHKSIYNTFKKKASFEIYRNETVEAISWTIHKH